MDKFKKLHVWRKAHLLVLEVYKATEKYPALERFCLVSQMRRAAISVAANIAESTKRKTIKDQKHFLLISESSLEELKYYFLLSYDLKYIDRSGGEIMTNKAKETGRMLVGLSKSISKTSVISQ
jgi:four helix bundle protein